MHQKPKLLKTDVSPGKILIKANSTLLLDNYSIASLVDTDSVCKISSLAFDPTLWGSCHSCAWEPFHGLASQSNFNAECQAGMHWDPFLESLVWHECEFII